MSKFIGKSATVNKQGSTTNGKPCVIVGYVRETRKYEVDFNSPWVGWYKLSELKLDEINR